MTDSEDPKPNTQSKLNETAPKETQPSTHSKLNETAPNETQPSTHSKLNETAPKETQPVPSEASVVSVQKEGRFAWLKKDKTLFAARYFVLAMLLASFFAGIPFAGYFNWRTEVCKGNEGVQCKVGSDESTSGYLIFYKSEKCLVVGFSLMLIALIVFIPRVILGSFSVGSTKTRRMLGRIGFGLTIVTAILVIISVAMVTIGGHRHLILYEGRIQQFWGTFKTSDGSGGIKTYPAALNVAIPMQASYWLTVIGVIPLVVFEIFALVSLSKKDM